MTAEGFEEVGCPTLPCVCVCVCTCVCVCVCVCVDEGDGYNEESRSEVRNSIELCVVNVQNRVCVLINNVPWPSLVQFTVCNKQ